MDPNQPPPHAVYVQSAEYFHQPPPFFHPQVHWDQSAMNLPPPQQTGAYCIQPYVQGYQPVYDNHSQFAQDVTSVIDARNQRHSASYSQNHSCRPGRGSKTHNNRGRYSGSDYSAADHSSIPTNYNQSSENRENGAEERDYQNSTMNDTQVSRNSTPQNKRERGYKRQNNYQSWNATQDQAFQGARTKQESYQRGRGQRGRYPRRGRSAPVQQNLQRYDYSRQRYYDDEKMPVDESESVDDRKQDKSKQNFVVLNNNRLPKSANDKQQGTAKNKTDVADARYSKDVRKDKSRSHKSDFGKNSRNHNKKYTEGEDETQRGTLMEQLSNGSYECMVCCEVVRCEVAIWNCGNCFHVFHLRCVKRWARSPAALVENNGWRCPACQNVSYHFPNQYRCFCGKVREPEFNRYDTPHSCGEVCRKQRSGDCRHLCNILCHPGPCPPCQATITKNCDCGNTRKTVKCGTSVSVKCDAACQKSLNCGQHVCQDVCHAGSCDPCDKLVHQKCHCEKSSRDVVCGTADSFTSHFSCHQTCDRTLTCGHHKCNQLCHAGPCEECHLVPNKVKRCPCGKTSLTELSDTARQSCLDPIPICEYVCDKDLPCGPAERPHRCKERCHEGACAECQGVTDITCRCGALTKQVSCLEARTFKEDNPFKCDKTCRKKKECGRHRCGEQCCVEESHPCNQVCGMKLPCGLHRCEETCHRSHCPACWQVSFEELHCHCGAEVLFPPIACGILPPECKRPCIREHVCHHPVRHNCHSDERCPPCTELTEKWCMGEHEVRRNIPCHLSDISCGMPCGKGLPCQQHKCQQTCHKGPCLSEGEKCSQPCTQAREECGHPCGAPCHPDSDECPKTACKTEITVKCECGNLQKRALCLQGGEERDGQDYQKMATMMMAMKMADAQAGQSIDISSITSTEPKKKARRLECTADCSLKERNRRLALALDIHHPELRNKNWTPPYSEFLRTYAKQNPQFVASIEKALAELVHNAQTGKIPKRNHAFAPMNRDKRRVIHELGEFYGCQTEAYDQEPVRNIVATAVKDKCWQPKVSLTTLIQRELHPKAPTPIPHRSREEDIRNTAEAERQGTTVMGAVGRTGVRPSAASGGSWASMVKSTGAVKSNAAPQQATPTSSHTVLVGSMSTRVKATDSKPKAKTMDYFDMTE